MNAEHGGPSDGEADGSPNPDPTMRKLPGKPGDENVPPKGGESMAPADSKHPYAKPGDAARTDKDGPGA